MRILFAVSQGKRLKNNGWPLWIILEEHGQTLSHGRTYRQRPFLREDPTGFHVDWRRRRIGTSGDDSITGCVSLLATALPKQTDRSTARADRETEERSEAIAETQERID